LSVTDAPEHELNALALTLRARSIRRWRPLLGDERGPGSEARAWALVNALDGLGDLLGTGKLGADEALAEFGFLLRATISASGRRPTASPKRGRRSGR
ncbi:MAG: hypothetical protein ACYDC2_13195, partial [Solirubrobacteraceae bacterium]